MLSDQCEDDLQVLIDFGLTLLEAKIYHALIINEATTAKVIFQYSGVSRPDVYRTLLRLAELGLVEKVISSPALFRAVSPEVAFQILLDRKISKVDELKSKSRIFIDKFRNNRVMLVSNFEYDFVLVPSRETLVNKLKLAMNNAEKSIDVITSCKMLEYACHFWSEALKDAWDRNVKGRAIVEKMEDKQTLDFKKVWRRPAAEFRIMQPIPSNIVAIYDKKEVFIFTKATSDFRQSPALWSNNKMLISLADYYFESNWVKSNPL